MTNHAHIIIGTKQEKMQDILRDLKKYTSKKIIDAIKENLRKVEKNGCYGCWRGQERRMRTI